MKKIKYCFEYFCSPFWVEELSEEPIYKNINIFTLPINSYLLEEINDLDKNYQSTFNENYPPKPLHSDLLYELIFANRVILSFFLLKKELEQLNIELVFDLDYWNTKLKQLESNII